MKVIDLLNKIAKGEEVPEKIKVGEEIFYFDSDDSDYYNIIEDKSSLLEKIWQHNAYIWFNLNAEIIEEKEIEELKGLYLLDGNDSAMPTTLQDFNNRDILKKINELVREVNKLKNK